MRKISKWMMVSLVFGLIVLVSQSVPAGRTAEAAERELVTSTGFEGRLAMGDYTACAVRVDGTAWCWGAGTLGALGNGTTADSPTPVEVCSVATCASPLRGVKAIAVGTGHACALLSNGTVNCWGTGGLLGDGTNVSQSRPVPVVGLTNVASIDAGLDTTCAVLADGHVRCWGWGFDGQLGNGVFADSNLPVAVCAETGCPAELSGVSEVAGISNLDVCARTVGGVVLCWGEASGFGYLGSPGPATAIPKFVCGGPSCAGAEARLEHVTRLDENAFGACVLRNGGDLWCWDVGPYAADRGLANHYNETSVHAGNGCGTVGNGIVQCWGANGEGELGNGTVGAGSATPVNVCAPTGCPGLFVDGVAVSLDTRDGLARCALSASGLVYCWGDNTYGQLGTTTVPIGGHSSLPVQVMDLGFAGARMASPGDAHTCATLGDGHVDCWGGNSHGQLGNGTTTPSLAPVGVSGLSRATDVNTGLLHACANTYNEPRCWGDGANGQLGNGLTADQSAPVPVNGGQGFVRTAAGSHHSCGIRADAEVRCWGRGTNGRLGNGGVTDQLSPVNVAFPFGAIPTSIDAGEAHTCARMDTGWAECWGYNASGQLDDTTTADRSTPVIAFDGGGDLPIINVQEVAAGGLHSCVLQADGSVDCWGDNGYGQVGNTCATPCGDSSVTGLSNAIGVTAGFFHTCALLANGTVKCWGHNSFGQLGNGSTADSSTPVTVSLPRPAVAVNAGTSDTTCAVLDDGTITCWGRNDQGQSGDGTTVSPRLLPVSDVLVDSDGDGIPDAGELGAQHLNGGQRDPFNRWDFFDTTGDGSIDLSDTVDVLTYFGDPALPNTPADLRDRDIPDPSQPWRTNEANDGVDLSDAVANLQSFGDQKP